MRKPSNYDNTQAGGDFTPIDLGGHRMIIKDVQETTSSTGRDMLKIRFDFAPDDVQPGYFSKSFADDVRPDKKWPNAGTAYVLTEDKDGNCSRNFKTFTTSVEKSNPGFEIVWGDKFAQCFKNKLIGGVFGIVEEEYNGNIHKNHRLRWFCAADKALSADIPKEKLYDGPVSASSGGSGNMPDFMNIPDSIDEELPFN